jgi:hypothetical protein
VALTPEEEEQLRLLIADTDISNEIFTSTDLDRFFTVERSSVRNAAARALETYAAHIAQVAGPVRGLLDIRVGGEQSAGVLLRVARSLRGGRVTSVALSNFAASEEAV